MTLPMPIPFEAPIPSEEMPCSAALAMARKALIAHARTHRLVIIHWPDWEITEDDDGRPVVRGQAMVRRQQGDYEQRDVPARGPVASSKPDTHPHGRFISYTPGECPRCADIASLDALGSWTLNQLSQWLGIHPRTVERHRKGLCAQPAKTPRPRAPLTHCQRGHAFDAVNTHIRATDGKRECRACRALASQRGRARNKAKREENAA